MRTPERDDRKQNSPSPPQNRLHLFRKPNLPLLPRRVRRHPVRRLHDHHVRRNRRYIRRGQVSIRDSRVISRIQHAQPSNIDVKHARPQHVPRSIRRHLDPVHVHLLMKINHLNLLHRRLQVLLSEQLFARLLILQQSTEILHEHVIYRLRRVRHEDSSIEIRPSAQKRHRGAVIEMKVRHEQRVDVGEIDLIKVRQRREAGVAGMDAAVEHERLLFVARDHATSTDFAPGAERDDLQQVTGVRVVVGHRRLRHRGRERGHRARATGDARANARTSRWVGRRGDGGAGRTNDARRGETRRWIEIGQSSVKNMSWTCASARRSLVTSARACARSMWTSSRDARSASFSRSRRRFSSA